MAKPDGIEARLAHLSSLDGASDAARAEIAKALADKSNLMIARAAASAARSDLVSLESDLVRAFERLLIQPVKTDKLCRGKTAVVKALRDLDCSATATFLAGARHVQHEPAFGGSVDTAAELRAVSILALAGIGYPDLLDEAARLLADRERQPRAEAARALAHAERVDGGPLLRLRIAIGDPDPDVIAACTTSLLSLAGERAVPFVAELLAHPDPSVADVAALSLGESRLAAAVAALEQAYALRLEPSLRRTLLLSIALTRTAEATDFLVEQIATGGKSAACDAVRALSAFRDDTALRERIERAVVERDDPAVAAALAETT
jgi:HEAT repeat protein